MSNQYTEHEKLKKIKFQSDTCGAFLDHLIAEGMIKWTKEGKALGIKKLLGMYFEIDLQKLNDEKEKMLDDVKKEHDFQKAIEEEIKAKNFNPANNPSWQAVSNPDRADWYDAPTGRYWRKKRP